MNIIKHTGLIIYRAFTAIRENFHKCIHKCLFQLWKHPETRNARSVQPLNNANWEVSFPVFVAPALNVSGWRQKKDLPVEKQDAFYKNHVIRRGTGDDGVTG